MIAVLPGPPRQRAAHARVLSNANATPEVRGWARLRGAQLPGSHGGHEPHRAEPEHGHGRAAGRARLLCDATALRAEPAGGQHVAAQHRLHAAGPCRV